MRIGYDAKRLFFNRSGLGNYSRSTVGLLARYHPENDYVLFSPRDPRGGEGIDFPLMEQMHVRYPHGLWGSAPSLWRVGRMGHAARSEGLDIFHGLSNELPSDIRSAHARSVVTMHDLIFVRYPQLYKPFDRAVYKKKYRRSCQAADRIIAISNQTREDLIDYWHVPEEKIEVIYQGCNPIFSEKASAARKAEVRKRYDLPKEYIVGVGTIEPRKNLLQTVTAVATGGLDIDIVAVGRATPYADLLRKIAARYDILDRLHLVHDAAFEELPAIYQMSRAAVYNSVFEGFGIPILEALNSGVPVITTSGGVFEETGGNAALYVDLNDTEGMVEALRRALYDRKAREEAIMRGYIHAAKFREEAIAENLMKFYRSVL